MRDGSKRLTRIFLLGDHQLIRAALAALVERDGSLKVVGDAAGCRDAVDAARKAGAGVILLDLNRASGEGLDCIAYIRQKCPDTAILVLANHLDAASYCRAVRLGAHGVISPVSGPELFLEAIRELKRNAVWLDPALIPGMVQEISESIDPPEDDPDKSKLEELTGREREVLELVAQGMRNREVADVLCVSETTVRHHMTAILSKLGVANRVDLMLFAFRSGVVSPPSR